MSRLQVSVLVPCYNASGTLPGLLDRLAAQDHSQPYEVVLVDDGSTDDTVSIVRSWQAEHPELPVQLHTQDNAGPAAARNRAAREARGQWLLFTDSDCEPHSGWVRAMVECLESQPEVGAVGGTYDIANPEAPLARLIHAEILWRHATMGLEVRFAGSYNLGVSKELFDQVGGFSTAYRAASGEDNDFSYRVLATGRTIRFCPRSVVAHHHTSHLFRYLREQYRHGRWRAALYRTHPRMSTGDGYTRWKDILEIPLALLVLCLLPFTLFAGLFFWWAVLLCLFAGLQLQGGRWVAASQPGTDPWRMAAMTSVRAFARTLGLAAGLWGGLEGGR